jgi:molecular chaperone GrpE (heat shock protein)
LISNAPNITWFELLSDALEDHFQKLFKQTQSKPLVTSEHWSDILIRMLDEMDKINEETNAAEQKAFAHFRKLIEDKLWDMGIDQDPIIIGETSFNAHIHELVGHQTTAIKEQNGKIAAVTRCGLLQKLHGKQSLLRKALVLVFTSDEI